MTSAFKPINRRLAMATAALGLTASALLSDALKAYAESDAKLAAKVRDADADLDAMYTSFFRELVTYMMEDPRTIGACTHLMFMAKNIEHLTRLIPAA